MQNINYDEILKKRFADNGNKLFFVDESRHRAYDSARKLLGAALTEESLVIVNNAKIAEQAKEALFKGADVEVITSADRFKHDLAEVDGNVQNASASAAEFKKKYPKVIICLNEKSRSLLHFELGKVHGKAGIYSDGDLAPYCVSDFLSDAGYSSVIVDDVYTMFDFHTASAEEVESYVPQKSERIDFMDLVYFTDIGHSYKKLKRIVENSGKAILITDVMADRNLITMYAGLSLINSDFSYGAAKKLAKSHSQDYANDIELMYGELLFAPDNETIRSLCLRRAKGNAQIVPSDIDSLGTYLRQNFNFMTQEEMFLRFLYAQAKKKYSMKLSSVADVINSFQSEESQAEAICNVFFSDALKGDMESTFTTPYIAKMNAAEIGRIVSIFNKYAAYCEIPLTADSCKIIRIYHDDSGFEDLVRRKSPSFDKEEMTYSASHFGKEISYKCIAVQNLLNEGKINKPVLVVTKSEPNEICNQFNKLIGNIASSYSLDKKQKSDGVTVITFDELKYVANPISASCAVFFDIDPDINFFSSCLKKANELCKDKSISVLVTYDDISGIFMDTWQDIILSKDKKTVPVRNTEVYMKGEAPVEYRDAVNAVDSIYKAFKLLIDGRYQGSNDALAKELHELISAYTLKVAADETEMARDLSYFSKTSLSYSAIFANSVSVSAKGREIIAEKLEIPTDKKKKPSYVIVPDGARVVFNICAKQLHEACDYLNKDCPVCKNSGNYRANVYTVFESAVKKFFKDANKAMIKITDAIRAEELGGIIGGGSRLVVDENEITIDEVKQAEKDGLSALNKLKAKNPGDNKIFYGDFSNIYDIKEAVQSLHIQLFDKFYKQFMEIYDIATDSMRAGFEAVGQSATHSEDTL